MMQVVLVMFRADGERRSFSITRDMTVIGRREDSDLRIPLGDVSRKHCRLIKDDQTLRVEDLGSSNGTFCNGQRITQCELNAGDTLQVGPVVFVAQIDGVPADDELQPVLASQAEPGDEVTEDVALEAVGADDATPGGFDPMEALTAEPEGSVFDFNIEDDLAGGSAEGDDHVTTLEEENAASAADQIVDLQESEQQEHDQNV